MLNRNHEYQCSLYTTQKQKEHLELTNKQRELKAKLLRQRTVVPVIKEEKPNNDSDSSYYEEE